MAENASLSSFTREDEELVAVLTVLELVVPGCLYETNIGEWWYCRGLKVH